MLFTEGVKGRKFKCDSCKKEIKGEDIKLLPAVDNISMTNLMSTFKFVDKDGKIVGGHKGPDASLGDMVTYCPWCDYPHLFGFDMIQ